MSAARNSPSVTSTFPHEVIRASAGTGKTYQLSNRYLALVERGARVDEVLAVTFARKAAAEILDRVLLRLAEATTSDAELAKLAAGIEQPSLSRAAVLDQLRQLVTRLHRLRIGTLDGFFVQLAGHFAWELGLPAGWRIVDDLTDDRLRNEALRQVLSGRATREVVTLLNLLSKGEVRRSVAQQMREVVDDLYSYYRETTRDAWFGLPHPRPLSAAELDAAITAVTDVALPDDKRWHTARMGDVQNASDGSWAELLKTGLAAKVAAQEDSYQRKPIAQAVRAAYEPLVAHARAVLVTQLAHQTEACWRLLDDFNQAYQRLKVERAASRFDDISWSLAAALADGRIANAGYRLDTQLQHLLLDEFQDTSLTQWNVVRPFAEAAIGTGGGTFFCVGDVKQAIYGWRGGVAEIFDSVVRALPEVRERPLDCSYRSGPAVIDTVNRVFDRLNRNTVLIDLGQATGPKSVASTWQRRFQAHSTARTQLDGYVQLKVCPAASDQNPQPVLTAAAALVRQLSRAHPQATIGVLVRRNRTVGELIHALRHHPTEPLAASEEGGNPLTDSAAVQTVLSLLRLADHPGDTVARFHVATSPLATVVGLNDETDVTAWRVASATRTRLLADGYGPTLYAWTLGLAEACDERELNRLGQLVDLGYTYDAAATLRLDDFVRYVEQTKVEDPSAAPVRVMTIHQAKGLQFDIVVLPELDQNLVGQVPRVVVERAAQGGELKHVVRYANEALRTLLPAPFPQMHDDAATARLNEALCVLYVALTRAVHALYLLIATPKPNEKTIPKTAAGLLRAALVPPDQDLEPDTIAWEHGNAAWQLPAAARAPGREDTTGDEDTGTTLGLLPATTRRRGFDRQSPSELVLGTQVILADRLQLAPSAAAERGTLIHAWLALIGWLEDGMPTDDALRATARSLGASDAMIDDELPELRALLRKPAIAAALTRATYLHATDSPWPATPRRELASNAVTLTVDRERSFVVHTGDVLLRGQFDRLVCAVQNGRIVAADVLDFKTDHLADAAHANEKVDHYRPQLAAYRRAAARLTGLDPRRISTRLLFVDTGLLAVVE